MKKVLCYLMMLMVLLPVLPAKSEAENRQDMRALLISCDTFVSHPDTTPAAGSNVAMLAQALLRDRREYRRIVTERDAVASLEDLKSAVHQAFRGADENDVSLFYISTHGVYPKGKMNGKAALVLSDGEREYLLTAEEMYAVLSPVPGKKVLILDACHSGALIGKGLSLLGTENPFAGDDFVVLTSAGGSEESWYWKSYDDGDPTVQYGAGYFASVVSQALSPRSPADMNMDGTVTMKEMLDYLYGNYAASTPCMYPMDSDHSLFAYDPLLAPDKRVVSGLTFDRDVLLPGQNDLSFTYTLHEDVNVYYQLIYHSGGAWDFENAQMIPDSLVADGEQGPGRRMRTLSIRTEDLETAGYVMLLIITKEEGRLEMHSSHLLCVQPAQGKVEVQAYAPRSFVPENGEEMNIVVRHDKPCSLSVIIEDEQGKNVCRLSYSQPSRPQGFPGTQFSWNGRRTDGTWAPAGNYRVRVETRTGGEKQTVYSGFFTLDGAVP